MSARTRSIPLTFYYFGLIVLLYLPIALLFLFSMNSSASLSFPIDRLTLDWYHKLFASDAVLRSARNSVIVAVGSSLAATGLGGLAACGFEDRGLGALQAVITAARDGQG